MRERGEKSWCCGVYLWREGALCVYSFVWERCLALIYASRKQDGITFVQTSESLNRRRARRERQSTAVGIKVCCHRSLLCSPIWLGETVHDTLDGKQETHAHAGREKARRRANLVLLFEETLTESVLARECRSCSASRRPLGSCFPSLPPISKKSFAFLLRRTKLNYFFSVSTR